MKDKNSKIEYFLLIAYSIMLRFFVSINSIRFNEVFTDTDQAIFFTIGKAMIKGKVLYKDIFDHKTPYIYFFNAFAALFEKNHLGLFILEILLFSIISIYLYKICRFYLSKEVAFIAPMILGTLMSIPNISFGYSRTEVYAIACLMIAIFMFAKYFETTSEDEPFMPKQMFIIGILAGITFMTNIRAIAIFVPFAVSVLVRLIKSKNYKNILAIFVAGLLGVVVSIVPYIIYAIATDSVKDAYYAIITTNINYAKSNFTLGHNVLEGALNFIVVDLKFFIFLFISFFCWFPLKFNKMIKIPIIVAFVITFYYVVFSQRTNVYYLVIFMPYLLSIYFLIAKFAKKIFENWKRIVYIASAVVFIALNIFINRSIDSRYNYCYYMTMRINNNLFTKLGNKRNARILSFGFNPDIYIFTGTVPVYKYFFIPNISYKEDSTIYDAQYEYIMERDPDVVIYQHSTVAGDMDKRKFDQMRYVLSVDYDLVDEYKTNENLGSNYIFIKKQ